MFEAFVQEAEWTISSVEFFKAVDGQKQSSIHFKSNYDGGVRGEGYYKNFNLNDELLIEDFLHFSGIVVHGDYTTYRLDPDIIIPPGTVATFYDGYFYNVNTDVFGGRQILAKIKTVF